MEHITEEVLEALHQLKLVGLEGMIDLTASGTDFSDELSTLRDYGSDIHRLGAMIDLYTGFVSNCGVPQDADELSLEVYHNFEPFNRILKDKARSHLRSCPSCLERYQAKASEGREEKEKYAGELALTQDPGLRTLARGIGKGLSRPYSNDFLGILNVDTLST